eukprot:2694556-Prymnesium_polylepis.1
MAIAAGRMNEGKRRVRRTASDYLLLPELPADFLDKPDAWVQFARHALMPGYSARDPFKEAQLGTSLAEMQQQGARRHPPRAARDEPAAALQRRRRHP